MEQTWILRGLLLQDVDAALCYPAPDLAGQEHDKDGKHPAANVVAERGHGQEGVENGIPGFLGELVSLDLAQWAVEETLQTVEEGAGADEGQVGQYLTCNQT